MDSIKTCVAHRPTLCGAAIVQIELVKTQCVTCMRALQLLWRGVCCGFHFFRSGFSSFTGSSNESGFIRDPVRRYPHRSVDMCVNICRRLILKKQIDKRLTEGQGWLWLSFNTFRCVSSSALPWGRLHHYPIFHLRHDSVDIVESYWH